MEQVTVRVPASTSNLGPGFDCLGVALRIYNHVTVRRSEKSRLPPIAATAARLFFKQMAKRPFPVDFSSSGDIPSARGLGASATIRLGILYELYEHLQGAFADCLHQPFRAKRISFLPRVVAAVEKAGALGAFLSASGSAICAVTLRDRDEIAAAMLKAAGSISARTIITTADNHGVQIRNPKPETRNPKLKCSAGLKISNSSRSTS